MDEGYDSGEDRYTLVRHSGPPEVNLRNVLNGMFANLTGRNKDHSILCSSSNVSFLGSSKNGETFLHSSVYIPSAPPLLEQNAIDYNAYKEILEAEPPEWLPDSSTTVCMQPDLQVVKPHEFVQYGLYCLEKFASLGLWRQEVMVLLVGSLAVLESLTNRAGCQFLQPELYHLGQEMICLGVLTGAGHSLLIGNQPSKELLTR